MATLTTDKNDSVWTNQPSKEYIIYSHNT